MKHDQLRKGDVCPCCGKPIETDNPGVLNLLTQIAETQPNYPWPEESPKQ